MRIHEIIFPNNEPADMKRADPRLHVPPYRFDNGLANLAGAFTKDGAVKHFWYLNRLERQPAEPAPLDAEPELIPSGTLEPPNASWQAEPVETDPSVGQDRLVPFQQYRGMSGD
jgi:hypothetical protein